MTEINREMALKFLRSLLDRLQSLQSEEAQERVVEWLTHARDDLSEIPKSRRALREVVDALDLLEGPSSPGVYEPDRIWKERFPRIQRELRALLRQVEQVGWDPEDEDEHREQVRRLASSRSHTPAEPADQRQVFICHADIDKEIATCLKEYMENADQLVKVFVASHPESLPAGREWWEDIRDNLKISSLVLTLVSSRSKSRPWIYFESGGAFFKGTTVIPLAVPPEPKSFPPPLGVLQGLDLGSASDVNALVGQLGQTLGVRFARGPQDLAAELTTIFKRQPVTDRPEADHPDAVHATWLDTLRTLAGRGGTVRVYPVIPALYADDDFELFDLSIPGTLRLKKLTSGHLVSIPMHRVVGVHQEGKTHLLEVRGRIQWIDEGELWRFIPESPDPSDSHGFARDVALEAPELKRLERSLQASGWRVSFLHEIRGKSEISENRQLVYTTDGRYLRIPHRSYNLVMVKSREWAPPEFHFNT